MNTKYSRLCAVLIGCSFSLGAQVSIHPVRTPAPIWPGDGKASGLDPKQRIFYDFPAAQAVILTRDASGNVVNEARRDIPSRATPSVAYSVARSQGALRYSYTITDPPSARQRTKKVSILVPDHDSGLTSIGWPTTFVSTTIPDHSATVSMATMRKLVWEDQSTSPAKIQGAQLGVRSTYLPGFGEAEVEGLVDNPITPADLAGLDAGATAQLNGFLEPGVGSTRYTVLVPMFRPDTSKVVIASNYSYGVQSFSLKRLLNSGSPYVAQLTASLDAVLQSGGTTAFQPVTSPPTTPMEQVIQAAVAIALQ